MLGSCTATLIYQPSWLLDGFGFPSHRQPSPKFVRSLQETSISSNYSTIKARNEKPNRSNMDISGCDFTVKSLTPKISIFYNSSSKATNVSLLQSPLWAMELMIAMLIWLLIDLFHSLLSILLNRLPVLDTTMKRIPQPVLIPTTDDTFQLYNNLVKGNNNQTILRLGFASKGWRKSCRDIFGSSSSYTSCNLYDGGYTENAWRGSLTAKKLFSHPIRGFVGWSWSSSMAAMLYGWPELFRHCNGIHQPVDIQLREEWCCQE